MIERGIFLMIWGDVAYGWAAYNFAMSLKYHSPNIPIKIVSQVETLKGVPLDYFDEVEWYHHPVTDPGLFKSQVYSRLPFKYTLYLDVDAIAVGPVEPLFDRLISEGKPYRCFVHTYYGKESEDAMPLMVWAYRKDIWEHYGLDDHQLPATQSSLQFIEKCEWSEQMFLKFQENFANPIPLQKLRNAWGGGQPDELYLNVTLAQLNYKPDLGDGIYFGNELTIPRPHQIKEKHPILSMFGTVQNIKSIYVRYYDGELKNYARSFGHRTAYEWRNIAAKKHANKRLPNMGRTRRSGMEAGQRYFKEIPFSHKPIKGSVGLFTSYYDTDPIRQAELDKVLNLNLEHPEITKIVNLGTRFIDNPKVINLKYDRPTYQDFLKEARSHGFDYTIIANSDIYFDETLNWIKQIDFNNLMLALSRWDVDNNGFKKLFNYAWSQDTWIFKELPKSLDIGKYWLGLPGCDNKFCYEVSTLGFSVLNTAREIRTLHIHNSNIRGYSESDRLPPPYKEAPIGTLKELARQSVCIKQPGKVGDIISCLPIAEFYAKDHIVFWECPKQYHHLFSYVDYVTPVETCKADKIVDISFGLNVQSPSHREWQKVREYESFLALKFRLAGVPFTRDLKYKRFEAAEQSLYDIVNRGKSGEYALVHLESDYGSKPEINTSLRIVNFEKHEGYSIFDWRKVIEGASEIHCIDSSLCNFVDIVKPSGELFYYKTDRVPLKGDETMLTANWKKINCYDTTRAETA